MEATFSCLATRMCELIIRIVKCYAVLSLETSIAYMYKNLCKGHEEEETRCGAQQLRKFSIDEDSDRD